MTTADHSLHTRLRFARIDAGTRSALLELRPHLEAALPKVLAGFYDHMAGYPEVSRLFGAGRTDFARNAQISHWRLILSGDFGDAYVASVRRIGATHARIGLYPRW